MNTSKTLVLVHGAWHGGWCWAKVATQLRKAGHTVFTPTLTGLGERRHLLDPGITVQTFIDDITNVLLYEDLNDVILVGHSFGGLVITGVADIMPHRVQQLVYLDALILESGTSIFGSLPPEISAQLGAAAQLDGQTLTLPPASHERLGLFLPQDQAFVEGRLTPQPLGSYTTSVPLQHPIGNGLPCTYVYCNKPPFKALRGSRDWVQAQAKWRWIELEAGHDAMVSAPDEVADLLASL